MKDKAYYMTINQFSAALKVDIDRFTVELRERAKGAMKISEKQLLDI